MGATDGFDPRAAAGEWWVFALGGLVGIVAGVIVLVEPSISLATLAVIAGIFLLVDGIIELVFSLVNSTENRALTAIFGVASVVIGVILIRHPTGAVVAIALLLGLWLLISGLLRLITSLTAQPRSFGSALLGLLELVAGIVIVSSPNIGVTTLAVLIGIAWILRGLAMVAVAWTLRRLRHGSDDKDLTGVAPAST
jgi:uncharacterized membrane protein HdeD (DUF308 family)